jgi:nitric oxide reductase subunit B
MHREPMPISSWWFQGAILTYVVGFTVLGVLAYLVYRDQPPLPTKVVASDKILFTRDDVIGGMNVFQRYGLMEYGSVYGHGAYLGPDFTAEYLHKTAELLVRRYRQDPLGPQSARERVAAELHENTYDLVADTMTWSDARAEAHQIIEHYYQSVFRSQTGHGGAQADWISNPDDVRKLTAFFGWTAWTATANRPGTNYSYTNNWPPEPLAGNTITAEAITWSVISIISLLGGAGLVFYLFGRYDWLGWSDALTPVHLRPVEAVSVTPAQRIVVWFLLVSSLLFPDSPAFSGNIVIY